MIILAIETSCDETAIAVLSAKSSKHLGGSALGREFKILSNVVSSQVELHAKWGGVVPSLAKREHIKNLPLVLEQALTEAKITESEIDHIAVTVGPGLEPALWAGINFAEELSKKYNRPLIGINHMEGHILSVLLKECEIKFPAMALLVSGGHTELVLISAKSLKHLGGPASSWDYKIIGATRDDAVGEAFDKVARMLGLPYPGGPIVAKMATNFKIQNSNFVLPRPMMHSGDYDFSFSGLKTAVLYLIKNLKKESRFLDEAVIAEICHEFQQAVIDVLVYKTIKAVKEYGAETVILGGGVSANKELRSQLESAINKLESKPQWLVPSPSLSTDNAAMIAVAAYFNIKNNKTSKPPLKAQGNLKL